MAVLPTPIPLPAYRGKLLGGARVGSPTARPLEELFFHLGYWPDPASAQHDFRDLLAAQKALNDRLLELGDLRDGLRVLDVGCGIGGSIAALGNRFGGMTLAGLNIDRAQLTVARASVRPRRYNHYAWVEADACALPFVDRSVDRVLAVECIFHFISRRAFFADAARVLRAGGRLVCSDFVASPALRALRSADRPPASGIEAGICAAVGPWPDFWGDDADNVAIARDAGLSLAFCENASRATQPSYRCFLTSEPIDDPRQATHADPVDRAMALMEWLQGTGLLDMVFFAFVR